MPLHPDAQAFLDLLGEQVPFAAQTVAENRAGLAQAIPLTGDPAPVHTVTDTTIDGPAGAIPIRVYRPSAGPHLPVVAYFHGGGWVLGDLALADTTCRAIAVHSGATVVSVDYRLAPEHPFPAAYDDALAVTQALLDGTAGLDTDPARVAVAGDSAGGNLAAAVALALRGRSGLRHQALIYPVLQTDVRATASYRDYATGYFLTAANMQWFLDRYAPGADPADPRLAPLAAPDLRGLPSLTLVTAECDPLRDEGERYAQRLREAGVAVALHRFPGQIHPFFYFAGVISAADEARRLVGEGLRAAFRTA